jgi:hypothetical protein
MRRLLFTQGFPPYNTGEEAVFEDETAGALVSRGVATYADPAPPVAVADDEPEDGDVEAKAPAQPPVDRMLRGGQTIRKKD